MTVDDLEQPLRTPLRFEARHKKLNEDRPILSQYKSYVDIRGGFLDRGINSNDRGVIENVDFQCFWTLYFRNLIK